MPHVDPWRVVAVAASFIHAVGVITAGHAVMKTRTSQGAIAWALALIGMPYVALPLYWVFGRDRFMGYVTARREEGQQIEGIRKALARSSLQVASPSRDSMALGVFAKLARMPFMSGNEARLLIDGEATFEAIFSAIREAKKYVLVQFFIIHDDRIGRELQAQLIAKAQQGVRVYLLYDEIGSHALPRGYVKRLREAGLNVRRFRSSRDFKTRFQINFRNHRKLVIVDGDRALVGGLNVGDEYLGRSRRFGPWRDTFVSIRGPSVKAAQLSFVDDFSWSRGGVPELDWSIDSGRKGAKAVLVLPTGPADPLENCRLFFVHAIESARRRIWITSPYFVPDSAILSALQLAVMRGVDVRIMLPSEVDHLAVYLAAFSYLKDTLPFGVKLYRYQGGFLHQKVLLVDDELAAVGTANLDTRSFRLQFEITLLFADRDFAGEVCRMLEADFARCRPLLMGEIEDRSFFFKVAVEVARLLAPVL